MTTTGLLALLAVLLLATACSDTSPATGGTEPTPTATPDPPDVDWSATVRTSAGEVVIEWSLTNRSGKALLLTNRVPDSHGRLSDRPHTAYVVPTGTDGQVEIAKRVFAVASDAIGDAFPWIGVTELAEGDTVSETIRVPLPLEGYAPPGSVDEPLPDPVTSVVFCVGVLVGRGDSWGFHEHEGTTTVNHGRALSGQAVLCSDPAEVA